jgi:signal transduction histidine kinase/CheY-like chemotaxis protein/HPt (histidine-containing phosphotransfer) domain-containing protein
MMEETKQDISIQKEFFKQLIDNEHSEVNHSLVKYCFNFVDSLIITLDGYSQVTFINHKGIEILEREERDIIGKNWFTEVLEISASKQQAIHNGIENTEEEDLKYQHSFRSYYDELKTVEVVYYPIMINDEFKGAVVKGEDVTNYLWVQEELQKSINLYRTLAGNIPGMNLFLFGNDLRFIIAEGRELGLLDINPDKLEGRKIEKVLSGNLKEIVWKDFKYALKGQAIEKEFTYNENQFYLWVYPVKNENSKTYAAIAITQNITQDKMIEKKLRKSKHDAEEANKAKSEFIANISHEIRTPLNAIIGFTEQLTKTPLSNKQSDYLKIIDKSSEHLLSLINDILVISRIEAGIISFEEEPFRLKDAVEEVYNTMIIKADEKDIDFNYSISGNKNEILNGDPSRLKQILMNLLSNAIKFTEKGYVDLKVFKLDENEDSISYRFDVNDTGIGIPKNRLKDIFDQFKQIDSAVTKKHGGTGLGLTICKKIVELQGGTIQVNSSPGLGSQFSVLISYKKGDHHYFEENQEVNIDNKLLEGLSVLLVDDDSVNRLLGKTILEDLNCDTDIAIDGEDALKKINTKKYDVILLDIYMPGMSGIELAKIIRKQPGNEDLPLIAVTAAAIKSEVKNFFAAGINDYLIKPFKEKSLYNKIAKTMKIKSPTLDSNNNDKQEDTTLKPYDLTQLKSVAAGKPEFFEKMIRTFINNANEGIKQMHIDLQKRDYENIGRVAHKMLPSFRHLEVNEVVELLNSIKNEQATKLKQNEIKNIVNSIKTKTESVTNDLEKEIDKL